MHLMAAYRSGPTVPIAALFDNEGPRPNPACADEGREVLRGADVIFGVDVMSQEQFVVYGRAALEGVVSSGVPGPQVVLRVELDQETEELERLIALVRVVKGHDGYE